MLENTERDVARAEVKQRTRWRKWIVRRRQKREEQACTGDTQTRIHKVEIHGAAWLRCTRVAGWGRHGPEEQCRHRVMTFRMGRHNGPDPRRIK